MFYQILLVVCIAGLVQSRTWEQEVKAYQSMKGNRPERQLFRIQGPHGPNTIKSYAEAEKLCKKEGATVADSWRLRDEVELKHYWKCTDCAWLKRAGSGTRVYYKNFRPVCGAKEDTGEKYYIPCADNPKDEGDGMEGYDVLCYGVSGPEIPPDSMAINVGTDKGYVFVLKEGKNLPLEERTNGATACNKRNAKLATGLQVRLAWFNGFSVCACGWMSNTQGISTREKLEICGNRIGVFSCPDVDQELVHSFCFIDARAEPRGLNLVDFSELGVNTFPGGIEEAATQIDGGYVYYTISETGPGTTKGVMAGHGTCRDQGARVATLDQLKKAAKRGMDACHCSVTWEGDLELLFHGTIVSGTAGRHSVNKVCNGRVSSCNKDAGGDVFCYKVCPNNCPPGKQWNVPLRSVKVEGGLVFHVDEGQKYKFRSKSAAESACKKKNGVLASRKQLVEAQKHGMTRCRCGYLSDGSAAFPIYRAIEGCGGEYGVFSCPNKYKLMPEKGPNWDAYCFISHSRLASTNKYDRSLMPDRPVEMATVGDTHDPDAERNLREKTSKGGHGVDDGKSMVKDYKQRKRQEEARLKEEAKKKRIAAREQAEAERKRTKMTRQQKAEMHQSVAGR